MLPGSGRNGFGDMAHRQKDTDLDALRQREDFRQLLRALKAEAPARERTVPSP
jgi:hypothetical protein